MKFSRTVVLFAVALVIAGLSGAAHVVARAEAASLPALPGKPAPPPLLQVATSHVPTCSDQDDDDDRDEVKGGKPDTDDIELECGDQDDDDGEVEDHAGGK